MNKQRLTGLGWAGSHTLTPAKDGVGDKVVGVVQSANEQQ
jgi:hypothetical protein